MLAAFSRADVAVATQLIVVIAALTLTATPSLAQTAGPPPLAGEVPLAGAEVQAPDTPAPQPLARVVTPGSAVVIPQLQCGAAATKTATLTFDPGVALACYEQSATVSGPPGALMLAQHLEAAGLFDEAAHRWRTLGTQGGGDRGLEATRRANALAELGLAQDVAAQGKAKRGKAWLKSAMHTLERQATAMGWPVPPAVAHTATLLARAARLRREAGRWQTLVTRAKDSGRFKARIAKPGRRAPAALIERCLGGIGHDFVRTAVALDGGAVLAVGEATAADGDTQLRTWILDPSGRTQRRADFGAGGPDRPYALALDGKAGAWVVGATDAQPGSDALFVRLDLQGRVRGHDERDGGGVDRAVAVVRVGPGRALALAEADTTGASDLWLLRLDAAGKVRGDARVTRKGVQRAHAFVLQGDKAWVGGADDGAGLLEAFDGAGHTQATVTSALPGVVLALAPAARGALWVVGRQADGNGWLGSVDKKGRLKVQRRFKPTLAADTYVQLLPGRRGVQLFVREGGLLGPAWLAQVSGRGKMTGRAALNPGGATGISVLLPAGKRALRLLGAARGCGRGTLDGWFAVVSTR